MAANPRSMLPDLATLTGVRSGKRSYYRAFVRSDQRMQSAVTAMDSISRALVRTVEGPRGLLEEVVRAAATYLVAEWAVLALADGHLRGARPRFLVVDREGRLLDDETTLPAVVLDELHAVRRGEAVGCARGPWVRVPMTLEGRDVGVLTGLPGLQDDPEESDLSVLRILANQAAVSLHTSEQYQASMSLNRRAHRLYDEAQRQARDLDQRTRELRRAEQRLAVAQQREIVDTERHRIARELHDSVTQYVLSAGMAVEVARGLCADSPASSDRDAVLGQLSTAKSLSQEAVEQLRRAIYALHQTHRDTVVSLPEILAEVADHHQGRLRVEVRTVGAVQPLGGDADHEIARAVSEALFNVTSHARATRAIVRLRYRPDSLVVHVSDDGHGDPMALARALRLERDVATDGRHRGLVNIESRVRELGGALSFRRARIGGVRLELHVPLPVVTAGSVIAGLVGECAPARVDTAHEHDDEEGP